MGERIRVLHVDDDDAFLELSTTFLRREDGAFEVATERSAEAGLARLQSEEIDCLVSDYDMPGCDGLAFLAQVREEFPSLPFILFTGKGSEEIASEAISKGVTDYLQKKGRSDVFVLLGRRIRNAVSSQRALAEAERNRRFLEKVLERSTDIVAVVDDERRVRYLSESVESMLGYDPEWIREHGPFATIHSDDRAEVEAHFSKRLTDPDRPTGIGFRVNRADGEVTEVTARAYNLTDDADVEGVLLFVRPED